MGFTLNRNIRPAVNLGKRQFVKAQIAAGSDKQNKYNEDAAFSISF